MTVSTTKKTEVIDRRQRVAQLYLQGHTMPAIASMEGVNKSTISRDLKALRKQWAESAQQDIDERINEQLAKYDALIAVSWSHHNDDGNPRYLNIVLKAMHQQEKILGIQAAKEVNHSGQVEITKGYVSISPDDWDTDHNKEQSASDYGDTP